MEKERRDELYKFYKDYLLNISIPFWLKNSLDKEQGGYITCLDEEGKVYNTDKSIWFQGRGTWMYSRLYNTVEKRSEWLYAAKSGYDFLIKHGFDTDGRMFFTVTKDGKPLQKRRYIFSEIFAVMALAEYSRASGDMGAMKKAKDIYYRIVDIYGNPWKTTPKINPATRPTKSLAVPMRLLATTQILREIDRDPFYNEFIMELVHTILNKFYKPNKKGLFETVGSNDELLDNPQGRCINPGHSMETAWLVIHEGMRRNDNLMVRKALEILDYTFEIGWDKEYGGIFHFVDIEGKPPEQPDWDMKLWWTHAEAMYTLLLAHHITGYTKYEEWHQKVHDWSFSHFDDEVNGEWFGYLHRDGTIANTLKGSMWKGPFHLPRALLFSVKLLERMKGK